MPMVARNLQYKDGRHYARHAVPKELQAILGKREIVVALGADRARALDQLPAALVAMKAQIAEARASSKQPKQLPRPSLSPKRQLSPAEIAEQHIEKGLAFDDLVRASGSDAIGMGFPDPIYIRQLRDLAAGRRPNPLPAPIRVALEFALRNGPLADEPATLRMLARAELLLLETEMARDEGEPDPPIPADLTPPKREADKQSVRILGPDSLKTLGELLPRLLAERKPTPSTAREYEVMVRQFEELIDPPPAIHEITRRTVQRFKDRLLEAPSSATKRFPGKTLPEAIEANKQRAQPYPGLDPKTINDKTLMRLNGLMNWAVRQDIIPDNPAAGVKAESTGGKSKAPPRVPFMASDIAKLFAPKLFLSVKTPEETRWAMLIGLFAGLRPSESAQMRLDSVRRERGVLCFVVEEETKTEGSRRMVPVHSTLIGLGFEDYVARLRRADATHLFPGWHEDGMRAKREAEAKGSTVLNQFFPRFIPRRFNTTYRKNAGITDDRKDFYAFRHTFKTGLSSAGVERGLMDQLCGHRDGSAGSVYVHSVSIEALRDAVESLSFDGFELKEL